MLSVILMIDNTKALVIYSSSRQNKNSLFFDKFAHFPTLCETQFRKHKRTIIYFFIEYVILLFFSSCAVSWDYSNYFAVGKIGDFIHFIHAGWIIFAAFSGLTIYGGCIAVLTNTVCSLMVPFYAITTIFEYKSIPVLIFKMILLLAMSVASLYYNSCVFDYSKKALQGKQGLFARKSFKEYIITCAIFLIFYISYSVINI